jgi:thiamine-monophosphate kinase
MSGLRLGPGREFDRIRQIVQGLGTAARGIGDDCAVLPEVRGRVVVSVDLALEDVHFRREWLSMEEIGWRAAAGALSDLAAEGAEVLGLLASVGVPREAPEDDLVTLMKGMGRAVEAAGGAVLGGDLSSSAQWLIGVTVLGQAARPVTRGGAGPGDALWITGMLGGARAALQSWRRGEEPAPDARVAFAHPEPRIRAGQALARAGARAMIDLSDGLGGDAGHLAAASGVGLEIALDGLPVCPAVAEAAARTGLDPAHFAALGGEDYELLVALPSGFSPADAAALGREAGVTLTRIGSVREGSGARFTLQDREVGLAGFDHFA